MDCNNEGCEEPIKDGEDCYQLRIGSLDKNDDFTADSDVGYYRREHSPPDVPADTVESLVVTRADVKENLKSSIDREPTEAEVDALIKVMERDHGQWMLDNVSWYLKNEFKEE